MSPAKEKLLMLEATGKYVFHGSESSIEVFEPRQAYNYIDGKNYPDGEPAIFASTVAEYAIFMAIINELNCPKGYHSSAGTSSGIMRYKATPDTLSQLDKTASGWVYVFDKNLFAQREKDGVEYISYSNVTPIEKIQVSQEDLPSSIEVQ